MGEVGPFVSAAVENANDATRGPKHSRNVRKKTRNVWEKMGDSATKIYRYTT